MADNTTARPVFEIGLVNAGAVSGGAYAAGALDFLYEALNEWQQAKDRNESVPDHAVVLKGAAGASAGAIGNALTAIAPWHGIHPIRDLVHTDSQGHAIGLTDAKQAANWQRNEFFRSWVVESNREQLFSTTDVDREGIVPSLLNADMVDGIRDNLLDRLNAAAIAPPAYPFIATPYQLSLSVTNLPGLPYSISMEGDDREGQVVTTHSDYVHFTIEGLGGTALASVHEPEPGLSLPMPQPAVRAAWQPLGEAVAASAAFPVGFRSRLIKQKGSVYDTRLWAVPAPPNAPTSTVTQAIPPAYRPMPQDYGYWAIDGGIVDNEPVELARRILAGPGGRMLRDADAAHRALLLLDPFPDALPVYTEPGPMPGMLTVAGSLFGLWLQQTRFRPHELAVAAAEDVRSRFLLAPVRTSDGERLTGARAICGGGLGGFAAFLCEIYRLHDFQLGRRNMQKFLRDHFTLDSANPVFGNWFARHPDAAQRWLHSDGECPIIPLCGTAAQEVLPYPWPAGVPLAEQCAPLVKTRLFAVVPRLLDEAIAGMEKAGSGHGGLWHRLLRGLTRGLMWLAQAIASRWLVSRCLRLVEKQIDAFQRDWKLN
ncbi:MAG: hypothetical protein VW600_06320 [Ferrovibrio sp.]